jgi:nucleoside-diphosphate-sugar epimerase
VKIFVTGATGYIGGSIAVKLVALGYEVTGLIRPEDENRVPLLKERGIQPLVGLLDDAETLMRAALDADAVIHAASADHAASVLSLVAALERTGKTLIHTTGSAIVADHADGEYAATVPVADDSYFEPLPYRRPRVDMNRYVRQAAIEKGVRSMVICPSMLYGTGRGLKSDSEQIPRLIGLCKQLGAGAYFGKGLNRYSNVHIDDLVNLYVLVLEKAPGGTFYFVESGHNSFKELATMISNALGLGGKTISLPVEQVIRQYGEYARLGLTSNSLISAVNARRLGWSPKAPSLEEWFKTQ